MGLSQQWQKSFLKINAGATISTYGVTEIKGKKYYILANDKYVLATNVTGRKRQLRHNSFVYNQKDKELNVTTSRKAKNW
ncbi:SLAP domain-containing protein [Lactobacillus sp. R2/2]|nr:SLAP domain-containing protein [Lactobacillus sp. R2/2]